MTDEQTVYVCPTCGMPVSFYPGFNIECKGRPDNPSHVFTLSTEAPSNGS